MRRSGGISKFIALLGDDRVFWRVFGVLFVIGSIVAIIASIQAEAEKTKQAAVPAEQLPQRRVPTPRDTIRKKQGREANVPSGVPASLPLSPSEEIEYYEANREYYLDGPEDIITYPDEIFDFNAD